MQTIKAADVIVAFGTETQTGIRYIIGEYIDDVSEQFVMSFLELTEVNLYEIVDIPQQLEPSAELSQKLWELLSTQDYPALVLPCGGYYIGDFFSSPKADQYNDNVLVGEKIAEVVKPKECIFDLVLATNGEQRITFFGVYAGHSSCGQVWRAIPAPQWLSNEALDLVYSKAEEHDAEFVPFDDLMQ